MIIRASVDIVVFMKKAVSTLTIALIAVSNALPALALTLPPGASPMLAPGTVVRWTARPDSTTRLTGRVVTLSGEALVVADDRNKSSTLAIPALTSLEILQTDRRVERCAVIGGMFGATAAVVTVAAIDSREESHGPVISVEPAYGAVAILGGVIGAAIGAVIGANTRGPGSWTPIPTVTALQMNGGMRPAIALGIRF